MASNLEKKIINQIEYYFGDINLPRDKFMQEKIQEDDGWITLDVLLTFKKLANLSLDPEVIANAVEKSDAHLVIVSEDKKKLRRNPDIPVPEMNEERKKELSERTAYAKGFPLDEELDNIVTFLEPYGPIASVSRRTNVDKITKKHVFKGSCFIIFKDIETCKKFVDAESVKYKDTELIRKFKNDYFESKKKDIQDKRKKGKKEKKEAPSNKLAKSTLPKGAILHFSGLTENQSISREEIKEQLKKIANTEIAFIDFNKGDTEGYIRFAKENTADEVFKKLNDGVLDVGETKLTFKVLEGKDEEAFLKKTADAVNRKRANFGKGKKRKGNFSNSGQRNRQKKLKD